ncbi:MAG: 6-phosphogluconolactonase [Nitrospina sp.]|jgi:6-phosphogluconolactonase|nr:6-phosphogluconolactonase [Nitrospina sp.]
MTAFRVFLDSESMAEEISTSWRGQIQHAEKTDDVFSVVLSGGTTASLVYRNLANLKPLESKYWERVHIFWADERCVPPEHEESNYLNIQRTFLSDIQVPEKNIHRIRGEKDPFNESLRYEKEIINHLALRKDEQNLFDWVLLGIGFDGHTASLFPGQKSLLDVQNLCAVVEHPVTGQNRITLTPSALNRSRRITYHVIGSDKAAIVSNLVSKKTDNQGFPTGYIEGEWFLDTAAASKINSSLH